MFPMRPQRKTRSSGAVLLVGLVLLGLCIGGGLFTGGVLETSECRRIQNGVSAPATITSAVPTERRGSKGRRYYGIDLTYRFEYLGGPRSGHRIGIEKYSTSSRSERDDLIRRLRPGAGVTARFEPGHPERAVLDPRITIKIGAMVTSGAGLIGLTLAFPFLCRGARFYRDDLPISTDAVTGPDGFEFYRILRREQYAPFIVGIVLATVAFQVLAFVVLGNRNSVNPEFLTIVSIVSVGLTLIGAAASRTLSPRGAGALEVHPARSTLVRRPLIRHFLVAERTIPMDRVTDITLTFKRRKHASKPTNKDAMFALSLETLTESGAPRTVKLPGLSFTRENAEELGAWLREELALDTPAGPPLT
jgi:hypothetical protein